MEKCHVQLGGRHRIHKQINARDRSEQFFCRQIPHTDTATFGDYAAKLTV